MAEVGPQVRVKLAKARQFSDAAELAVDEAYDQAVSSAGLAAINASDALCLMHHGFYPQGKDHRQAAAMLRSAGWGVAATHLLGAILNKDKAQYSAKLCTPTDAAAALKHAERLLDQATKEAIKRELLGG